MEQGQEIQQKKQKGNGAKFAGSLLISCLTAAAFFFFWGWFCFTRRLSPEVIRAGILLLYALPCLTGGRILKKSGTKPVMVFAFFLGLFFWGILYGVSCICTKEVLPLAGNVISSAVLCLASAELGTIGKKRSDVSGGRG